MCSINEALFDFIEKSPCAVFAVDSVKKALDEKEFTEYKESDLWNLSAGTKAYVIRNDSSMIAFTIPKEGLENGFNMICAHSDSPCFKIKEKAENKQEFYVRLNVEKYGQMIMGSWLDRPLSAAGRVVVKTENGLCSKKIDFKREIFMIPNLAIHMTRGNSNTELNPQIDLQPLAGDLSSAGAYYNCLAELAGVPKETILGTDLFLYNPQRGCYLGLQKELIGAPRLDDLQCVFAGMKALTEASQDNRIHILGIFDNEEVGSLTRQGADSDFLFCTLMNIAEGLGQSAGDLRRALQKSFLISADNAHAVHVNHQEKADPTNRPYLNQGIVIKYHGNQKYTTDAFTGAVVKQICMDNAIPYQTYHNRSDIAGGSTLGNIALGKVSVPAADIGAAQLAMHSAFETAGALDTAAMADFMRCFYEQR